MLDVAVDKESPVITTTLETSPAVLAGTGGMEQHWQGFGYYYPEGQHRDAHPNESHSVPPGHEHATSSHHRANTFPQRQQSVSSYHPARPPSTGPPGGPGQNGSPHHLPPFAQFYPQQHYQPPPTQSPTQTSHSSGYSHSYVTSTSPNTAYSSYTTGSHLPSPASASGSRGPPPSHAYPPPQALRTQFTNGTGPDYSTSPHPRQLSPTSPASRAPMTAPSSGGPGPKRRSHSASYSNGSWDEDKHGDGLGETNEKEPWGMPQDEYRALNPRDKKQVRNRIGARRFRAKRKDYVASLEASIQTRNDEIESLRAQLEGARVEIAGYRDRLGLPVAGTEDGGLGLQGAR